MKITTLDAPADRQQGTHLVDADNPCNPPEILKTNWTIEPSGWLSGLDDICVYLRNLWFTFF